MNKKILTLLCVLISAGGVLAADFSAASGGKTIYYNILSSTNRTVEVVAPPSDSYSGSISLPSSVSYSGVTYTVTSIGSKAFLSSKISAISLPSTLTNIGTNAFNNCQNLYSVTLPNSVTSIGLNAFARCSSLSSVTLPNGIQTLGGVFGSCTGLVSVTIPASVTWLYDTFTNCSNLETVTFGANSQLEILQDAFSDCTKLTSITLPFGLKEIQGQTFIRCSSLASINTPSTVTNVEYSSFIGTALYNDENNWDNGVFYVGSWLLKANSSDLSSHVTVRNGTTLIASSAFANCSTLKTISLPSSLVGLSQQAFSESGIREITIPSGIKEIGYRSFYKCSSLTSVNMSESSVQRIYAEAFYNCSNLEKVSIPETISEIGQDAFNSCSSLAKFRIDKPNPSGIQVSTGAFDYVNKTNCVLSVPASSISPYSTNNKWSDFKIGTSIFDGKTYDNTVTSENAIIDYERTFSSTNWQGLYLPFSLNYDDWKDYADIAEIFNVRGYDNDNDEAIDEIVIEFNKLSEGSSTMPNVPYVIRPKAETLDNVTTFTTSDPTKIYAAPATEGTVECASTKITYRFCGVYEPKYELKNLGAYHLYQGEFCQPATTSFVLNPNRFYLLATPKTSGYAPAANVMRIRVNVIGEGEVTGIEGIDFISPNDDIYYDLMGRRVNNPEHGIYIHNGKKVLIK